MPIWEQLSDRKEVLRLFETDIAPFGLISKSVQQYLFPAICHLQGETRYGLKVLENIVSSIPPVKVVEDYLGHKEIENPNYVSYMEFAVPFRKLLEDELNQEKH